MDSGRQITFLLRYRFPTFKGGSGPWNADHLVELIEEAITYTGDHFLEQLGTLQGIVGKLGGRAASFDLIDRFPERDENDGLVDILNDYGVDHDYGLADEWRVFRRALIIIVSYREYLQRLSIDAREEIYHTDYALNQLYTRREAAHQEGEAFFNDPKANARYSYYSGASYLTLEEAVALSLGKEPKVVSSESLQLGEPTNYFSKGKQLPSPFREEFERRLDLTRRAIEVGRLTEKVNPQDFVLWAQSIHLSLPDEFKQILKDVSETEELSKLRLDHELLSNENNRLRKELEEGTPSRQRLKMLYKIFIGMAVSAFEFKYPGNTLATTNIQVALNELQKKHGLNLKAGNDKIRDWLKEAAEAIDFSLNEPIDAAARQRLKRLMAADPNPTSDS